MSVPKRDELCPFGDLQFVWDFRSHLKCLGMRKFSHISEKSYAGGFEASYIFITVTQSCSLAHSQQGLWVPVSHSIPWSSCGTCPSVWMPQFLLWNWLWYAWQHPKMTAWVQTYPRVSIVVPLWLLADRKILSYSLPVFILHFVPGAYKSIIPQRKKTVKYFKVVFFSPGETVHLNFQPSFGEMLLNNFNLFVHSETKTPIRQTQPSAKGEPQSFSPRRVQQW